MAKTVLQDVKELMKELLEKKAAQMREIQSKLSEARAQEEVADQAIQSSTENMDLDAFENAQEAKRRARVVISMYSSRYAQLQNQEIISEEESDKVIDDLLAYEKEIGERYKSDIRGPLQKLDDLTRKYQGEVAEVERTISAWGRDVHANYTTRGRMQRTDPLTGEKTDRAERPVPVRVLPYTGCDESAIMETFLKDKMQLRPSE